MHITYRFNLWKVRQMRFAFASYFFRSSLPLNMRSSVRHVVCGMHSQVSTENTQSFDSAFNLLCAEAAAVALVLDACLMVSYLRRNKDDGAKAASANCVANNVHKQRRKSLQVRKCLRLGFSRERLLFYYLFFLLLSRTLTHYMLVARQFMHVHLCRVPMQRR